MHIALVCLLAAGIRVIAADVRGIVVDSQSGAGIAAVTVRLTMAGELVAETFTDEDGTFVFEGVVRGRYGCFWALETWRSHVVRAGFEEISHYYRPPGRPRHEQPWLASVWRRVEMIAPHDETYSAAGSHRSA